MSARGGRTFSVSGLSVDGAAVVGAVAALLDEHDTPAEVRSVDELIAALDRGVYQHYIAQYAVMSAVAKVEAALARIEAEHKRNAARHEEIDRRYRELLAQRAEEARLAIAGPRRLPSAAERDAQATRVAAVIREVERKLGPSPRARNTR